MAEDEYRFIEEKIKPQRKRRILNVLRKLGITGVYAIVFGVVASLALFATNKILASGGNEQPQPTVMLPKPTATPSALPTSTPTPEQETMAPEEPTSIDDVNTIIQDYEEMYDVFAKFCDS